MIYLTWYRWQRMAFPCSKTNNHYTRHRYRYYSYQNPIPNEALLQHHEFLSTNVQNILGLIMCSTQVVLDQLS